MTNIRFISTADLIKDYNRLEVLEEEQFTLCEKYNNHPNKHDEIFYIIKEELGRRQIEEIDVK